MFIIDREKPSSYSKRTDSGRQALIYILSYGEMCKKRLFGDECSISSSFKETVMEECMIYIPMLCMT